MGRETGAGVRLVAVIDAADQANADAVVILAFAVRTDGMLRAALLDRSIAALADVAIVIAS